MSNSNHSNNSPNESGPRKRRARYPGTHPRKYAEKYKELHPTSFPGIHDHVVAQGRTPVGTHTPVLLAEVLNVLSPQPGESVADCTLGFGGHAQEFLRRIGPAGNFIGLDVDATQLARTRERLLGMMRFPSNDGVAKLPAPALVHLAHAHYSELCNVGTKAGVSKFDVVFADLGVSSMQIDDPERGFSFKHDGPLDMRMDPRLIRKAMDVIAELPGAQLATMLCDLADEPDAQPIADAIVRQRAFQPIDRTSQLVDLVFKVKGLTRRAWRNRPAGQRLHVHPAARTFQALRIYVNDELGGLERLLQRIPDCLRPAARVGVISFHSKEDALVDKAFCTGLTLGIFREISKLPIRPGAIEVAANPRSRSALLRWAKAF